MQRAAAGAGHDQGVISVVSGVLHDLRAGVTPQENGFDLPAGKLLGEVGQLPVGLDGRPVPLGLGVGVARLRQDHEEGDLRVLAVEDLLGNGNGALAAGAAVDGQYDLFHVGSSLSLGIFSILMIHQRAGVVNGVTKRPWK